MTTSRTRRIAVTRTMATLLALSPLALASTTRAAEPPTPEVVESKSALPRDCVSLGDVSGRHADESPRPERAQAEAASEARAKGATHMVTGSAERCGGNSFCYEGVAYRCPAPGGASAGK
jgi:hypothetical protein